VLDDGDDGEPVWVISTSLSCSVRSENCEVVHLNSNMVAASLKQSGLITDRAYNQLTTNEDTLTRNALKFLWLLVQRSSNCYNLFIEAAQALCSRAMKTTGNTTRSRVRRVDEVAERNNKTGTTGGNSSESRVCHVNNIAEQNNKAGKTAKQQQQQPTSSEENLENLNLANGDNKNNSLLSQQGLIYCIFHLLPLFICLTFSSSV